MGTGKLVRPLRKPLVALAAVLLTLLAAEGGLRLAGYRPELQQEWYLTNANRVPDDDVIMIRPDLLRARTFTREPGEPLVVAIGDSFTEGFPVFGDKTWPAVLARFLRDRGVPSKVVNAGLGNSGPDQQLRLLQTRVLPHADPDVVVWQLYGNDLWDNVARAVFTLTDEGELVPRSGRRHWLHVRQRIHDALPLPDSVKRGSYLVRLLLKAVERFAGPAVPPEFEADPQAWGARKLARELEEARRLSRERGFDLLVVLIPPQSVCVPGSGGGERNTPEARQPAGDPVNLPPGTTEPPTGRDVIGRGSSSFTAAGHRRIREILREFGDHLEIDLGEKAAPVDPADLFAGPGVDPNPAGNRHLNAAGYRLVGRQIGARVLELLEGRR